MDEIIVKYFGDLRDALKSIPSAEVALLFGGYAVIRYPLGHLDEIKNLPEIIYAQQPVKLYFETGDVRNASCINTFVNETGLNGSGVLIGIIDSGVQINHQSFIDENGETRFLFYWDQVKDGTPPEGYYMGKKYTRAEINELLKSENANYFASWDNSGHGTAVAGIAAGYEQDNFTGVAPRAGLIGVRLGSSSSYPRTSELMQAVNYCLECALRLSMPIVINLSFGNNYGDHRGDGILEDYLNNASTIGRTCIVVGTGNEGASSLHAGGHLTTRASLLLSVGSRQSALSIQLWKAYADEMSFSLKAPNGDVTDEIESTGGVYQYSLTGTEARILVGRPTPYQLRQGIYIELIPSEGSYVTDGIWEIILNPLSISSDRYDLWLPVSEALSGGTRFLTPDPEITLTIPSTADRLISVGSYDSNTGAISTFSGRGYTASGAIKPDILAPGESILAPLASASTNLYAEFTGTSFSVPIVSGAAALLMQWGIVQKNDSNLYGQKIRAYLQAGARPINGEIIYPNPRSGYGSLCLYNCFRLLNQ